MTPIDTAREELKVFLASCPGLGLYLDDFETVSYKEAYLDHETRQH